MRSHVPLWLRARWLVCAFPTFADAVDYAQAHAAPQRRLAVTRANHGGRTPWQVRTLAR